MIDQLYSRPKHLIVAVPVSAFTGALVMILTGGPREPLTVDLLLFAVPTAGILAVYALPFALIGGVVAYFTLRSFQLLSAAPFALVGLGIGLAAAALLVVEFFRWASLYAVAGVVAALAGYCALWLLARPPAPNLTVERDARESGVRTLSTTSKWAAPGTLIAAVLSAIMGAYIAYDSFTSFIPPYEQLVVAKGPSVFAVREPTTHGLFGRVTRVEFYLDNNEVWTYQSHLPRYSEVARLDATEVSQLTLRASPRFGRDMFLNYTRGRSVRQVFEVWIGSRQIVGYDHVVAARKDSSYPILFYFGLALMGLGLFIGARYVYARRAA